MLIDRKTLDSKTFLHFLPYRVRTPIINVVGWLEYKKNLFLGKPHFGYYLHANMQNIVRAKVMKQFFEGLLKSAGQDYKVLEIGSWGGESTTIWASICKIYKRGKVFCVDTWMGAKSDCGQTAAFKEDDNIMKLFLHNIKVQRLKEYVNILRGTSDEIASILQRETFDFVYIDGDHSYSQFMRDLNNYSKLCKIGGILCGDDLPLDTTRDDLDKFSDEHKEENDIFDSVSKTYYFPGVFKGIKEFFGRDNVGVKEGFWAAQRTSGGWEKIDFV